MSNVALGKPVLEKTVRNPHSATDGVTTGYTDSAGYASFTWPGSLTVDLQREYSLKCIRLLLWDGRGFRAGEPQPRRYKYRLHISLDGNAWDQLYETPEAGAVGWQVFHLTEAAAARFIRVEGVHNTANNKFHVVELEAHEIDPEPLPSSVEVMLEVRVQPSRDRSSGTPGAARRPTRGRPLQAGMVLDCYRLVQRLGKGHSATVWKAEVLARPPGVRLRLGDVVAIKVYDPALVSGSESMRIQREFAVASEADHPGLVKVFDVVISPSRPWHTFLVMEYVQGHTLKQYLADHGPCERRDVLSIGRQLFDALDALHSTGALHRDVKAANVILVDPQQLIVKLLDFGIVLVEPDDGLTATSVFLGSKHYAPLEQLTGKIP